MKTVKVITYQTDRENSILLTPEQATRLAIAGVTLRDSLGGSFCHVAIGLHTVGMDEHEIAEIEAKVSAAIAAV